MGTKKSMSYFLMIHANKSKRLSNNIFHQKIALKIKIKKNEIKKKLKMQKLALSIFVVVFFLHNTRGSKLACYRLV
jgi:hypothetical protein